MAIFVPRGKRSDWIFINVFFLLIYRKRKFCAEPMREWLTFHFELRTRSGNFRFFFFSSFLFVFFQIKARSRLVTLGSWETWSVSRHGKSMTYATSNCTNWILRELLTKFGFCCDAGKRKTREHKKMDRKTYIQVTEIRYKWTGLDSS